MQYNFDQHTYEFVENPTAKEGENITGNRVWTLGTGPEQRIRVEIDGNLNVIAALDRLVKRIYPNFVFPKGGQYRPLDLDSRPG